MQRLCCNATAALQGRDGGGLWDGLAAVQRPGSCAKAVLKERGWRGEGQRQEGWDGGGEGGAAAGGGLEERGVSAVLPEELQARPTCF